MMSVYAVFGKWNTSLFHLLDEISGYSVSHLFVSGIHILQVHM